MNTKTILKLIIGTTFILTSVKLFAAEDLEKRIAILEKIVYKLEKQLYYANRDISSIKNSNAMALNPYLTVDSTSDERGPMVTLDGINLQIVNGTGTTDGTANGLGNVIIGYDEKGGLSARFCSDGLYSDQTACETAGEVWGSSHKNGSHYLVIGKKNSYSQYAGIVSGIYNSSNRMYASVTGGMANRASGAYSSVTGGSSNNATGFRSSVTGGQNNKASGSFATIQGGMENSAEYSYSSIVGGVRNRVTGAFSTISGGGDNLVAGWYSSILGGQYNRVNASFSVVVAGGDGTEQGGNINNGQHSVILGGVGQRISSFGGNIPVIE